MLRTAFLRIPLRQAEGMMASVFRLMNISLAVPHHTTVSRGAAVLPGQFSFATQKTEVAIGVAVLNYLLSVAWPVSVRKQVRSA